MAEREAVTPDSISTLIYVDMRGKTGGYRTDLLKEQVSENMKKLLICSKCDGISKETKMTEGKTFCTNCTEGRGGEVDGRVDGLVRELKCRCPLSTRGCDWSGKLDNIEEHMNGCDKVKIKCQKGCGEVLQKCDTIHHQKECPFRILECEYCKENVRANQANEHIRLCEHHPDGVVTCPFMEVGCDTIEIARKNLETHITQNVVGHQKLLLHELNQLRTENKQLRADNEQLRADNEQLRVTNERHEQSIQSHEQSILYSCTLLSTGQLEWKIKGVKQKIENKEDTYSDPFYAGLYKCQGCIQWNCLFFSKVGVYICIMKGDYDDKLHWPIRYKYTFIILNHINSNNNYEYTNQVTKEYLEKYPDNLKKPTQMRNQGYANFFISKTEILEAKYCKEDSITLLIKIELLPAL